MENPVILTDLALLFSLRVRFAALVGWWRVRRLCREGKPASAGS